MQKDVYKRQMVVNLDIADDAVVQGHFKAASQQPEIYLVYVEQLVQVIGKLAL